MEESNLTLYQRKWAQEKYLVMVHSQAHYNALRVLFKGNVWSPDKESEFEKLLQEAYEKIPSIKTLRTTYQHIWGYFKKIATKEEKESYKQFDAFLEKNPLQMHRFLQEMTRKYQPAYLLNSRIMKLDHILK